MQSLGARVAIAQQKAIQWLDRNLNLIKEKGEPYEVALVAYALKLTQSPIAEQAFGILADHARTIGEYMYWGNIEGRLTTNPLKITLKQNAQPISDLQFLNLQANSKIKNISHYLVCHTNMIQRISKQQPMLS